MDDIFKDLFKIARKLSIMNPYASRSDYYAIKDAAWELSKALPKQEQQNFMDFVHSKIKGLSNYAGD